jgi:hypothetical protein
MSLSINNKYNAKLRKMVNDLDRSPADSANFPEMLPMKIGGRPPRKHVLSTSVPYAPPLAEVLEAERELRSNPMHVSGGNVFDDIGKHVKDAAKSAAKSAKVVGTKAIKATKKDIADVKRVANEIAKSKEGKMVAKVGKKVGKEVGKVAIDSVKESARLGLDIATKAAPALGGLAGAALAVASLNPELAPVAGAIGAAAASELAKRGRTAVKKSTGLGIINKEELKKLKKKVKKEVKEFKEDVKKGSGLSKELKDEIKQDAKKAMKELKELKKKVKKEIKTKEGSGKPANKWVMHVKQYANEHGIPYKEAMSKAKASYKKSF